MNPAETIPKPATQPFAGASTTRSFFPSFKPVVLLRPPK